MARHADDLREALRARGLRATPARLAVLALLRASDQPLSHGEVGDYLAAHAWDQATLNHLSGYNEVVRKHLGKRYQYVSMRFSGVERYPTYAVHKEPVVTVRDAKGAQFEVRAFGSILERGGQFKLFSYVVE